MKPRLLHVSPMPPAHNGIADYAYLMLEGLKAHTNSIVLSETPGARAPSGVRVFSPSTIERKHYHNRLPVYQIGNNWQHTGPLRAALADPGMVVLHDLQLLYLYESLQLPVEALTDLAMKSNPFVSARFAARLATKDMSSKLPYMLANMLAEVVTRSKRVMVHSGYGRTLIERHFGSDVAERVDVVPHFAIRAAPRERQSVRQRLGIDDDRILILTAGFATKAKQMDLVARALAPLVRHDRRLLWIHAGSAGDEYYNLHQVLEATPDVAAVTRITGYLSEAALDDHVAAADLMINLRFPSVGESSGSLARALASGACALVTNTGGYAEYPSNAVLKLDPLDSAETLSALIKAVCDAPDLRQTLGRNARAFADDQLSMDRYIKGFLATATKAKQARLAPSEDTPLPSPWFGPIESMYDAFDILGDDRPPGPVDFIQRTTEAGTGIFVRRRS